MQNFPKGPALAGNDKHPIILVVPPASVNIDVAATKAQTKVGMTSFNILDHMKKENVCISMWDFLGVPGQKDLLQSTLSGLSLSGKPKSEEVRFVMTNTGTKNEQQPLIVKPPPFYVSLIIGEHLVHNCMIDSRASSSVMPKQIADKLGIKYE